MADKQSVFFNLKTSQYPLRSIINPPYHTFQEIKQILNFLRKSGIKGRIADFGSGTGRLSIPLLRNQFSVLAIDLSSKSLQQLIKTAKKLKLNRQLQTASRIEKSVKLEAIVGTDILHHLNIKHYFPEFYHRLKSEGVIAFSEPNYFNLSWHIYLRLFSNWSLESGIKQCTYQQLFSACRRAGFTEIKIIGYGLLPLPLLNWSKILSQINLYLGNLPFLKPIAYRYLIFAKKISQP